jgi:hypothetical protein
MTAERWHDRFINARRVIACILKLLVSDVILSGDHIRGE